MQPREAPALHSPQELEDWPPSLGLAETKASIVNSDVCLAWKRRRILSRLAAGRMAGTCPQASVLGGLGGRINGGPSGPEKRL